MPNIATEALKVSKDEDATDPGVVESQLVGSVTNVKRATQTDQSASRTSREHADVVRAQETLAEQKEKRLEAELSGEDRGARGERTDVEIETLFPATGESQGLDAHDGFPRRERNPLPRGGRPCHSVRVELEAGRYIISARGALAASPRRFWRHRDPSASLAYVYERSMM